MSNEMMFNPFALPYRVAVVPANGDLRRLLSLPAEPKKIEPGMDHDGFSKGWNAAMRHVREHPDSVLPVIERLIFNDPATIVYWSDGVKTVVKCQPGDTFSAETGLMAAMLKRFMGNDNSYNKVINYWLARTDHHDQALPAPEIPVLPEATPPIGGDDVAAE